MAFHVLLNFTIFYFAMILGKGDYTEMFFFQY